MQAQRATFPKAVRLRRRREFLAVQREGRRSQSEHFVVLWRTSPAGATRLGITVSRRVGDAVARNRLKRLVREVFRQRRQHLGPPQDVIVIARVGAAGLTNAQVLRELGRILGAARVR